ncbi:acyl-CoA reductase-like NAD-dependent aldehyde dehydrogenase [Bradyrhizobium sp. CIR18]|nr:acyl-CoA reductase-like NAD-dependent aldehyde dehydrogenase [Bradyrhizobium sp. CIR18]
MARRIRAGNINLQRVPNDLAAPFGGYKQSGNGREWGKYGLEEFLEVKAVAGVNRPKTYLRTERHFTTETIRPR